jgi:ribosomal protein S1
VVRTSQDWVDYCTLNLEISRPEEVEKIGRPLLGMVASITDKGVFFKLNIGRTGVCSTPSALKRMVRGGSNFAPVQVGDTVELAVSGVSIDGRTIYVDRRDPDWEYFDFFRRPSPTKKGTVVQEYRHIPSLVEGEVGVDPLLRRGLGEGGDIDSDDEGDIDHEPVLTKKPTKTKKSHAEHFTDL